MKVVILAALLLASCCRIDTDPLPEYEAVMGEVACRAGEQIYPELSIEALLCEELTLKSAIQIALLNNYDLKAVYQTLGIGKAQLAQAGLLTNPVFDLSWRFSPKRSITDLVDWGLFHNLIETLLIPMKKRAAANELEAAKLMVATEMLKVIGRTKQAFYSVQALEEMWRLKQEELLALECAYEAAEQIVRAGNQKELDVEEQRMLFEEGKLEAADLEIALLEAREELNLLLGLWGDQICWQVACELPEIEPITFCGVENLAIANSLDLQLARRELHATAALIGIDTTRLVFPQMEIGAAGEREDSVWFIGPAFATAIPLFDFGQAAAAAGQAEILRQWNLYTAQAVEIRSAARSMRFHLMNATRQYRYLREKLIPTAERITVLTLLQHNAMQLGVLDLLSAKREEIRKKMEAVELQRIYWIAQTELETLLQGHRL